MHPINSKNFGAGKIAVTFVDGTTKLTGYIVKQTGLTRYAVTTDGEDQYIVELAQTTADAELVVGTPTEDVDGKAVIVFSDGTDDVFARKIQSVSMISTEGESFAWSLSEPSENTLQPVLHEEDAGVD